MFLGGFVFGSRLLAMLRWCEAGFCFGRSVLIGGGGIGSVGV